MNKYDMMIACNRKTSEEKINRAVNPTNAHGQRKGNCTKISKADRVIQRILLQERNRQKRNGPGIRTAGRND